MLKAVYQSGKEPAECRPVGIGWELWRPGAEAGREGRHGQVSERAFLAEKNRPNEGFGRVAKRIPVIRAAGGIEPPRLKKQRNLMLQLPDALFVKRQINDPMVHLVENRAKSRKNFRHLAFSGIYSPLFTDVALIYRQ